MKKMTITPLAPAVKMPGRLLKNGIALGPPVRNALETVAEALWDAADEDIATGGPDFIRKIFPTLYTITQEGVSEVPEATVEELYQALISRL